MKKSVKRSGSPNGLIPAGVLSPEPTVGDLERRSALKKKASALPVIVRPEYSSRLGVQERMTLRPRHKLSPRIMTRSQTKQTQPGDAGRRNPKTEPRTRSAVSRRTVKKKKKKVPCISMPDPRQRVSREKEMVRYFEFSSTEEEMGRYLEFNLSRMVSAAGFTEREFSLCSEYLIKRDYEFLETIPEEFKYELEFIEEIREGKGYRLIMHPPPRYIGKNFNWYFDEWKNNAEVKEYVSKMIKMVLDDMEIRFQDPEQKFKVRYRYDPKYGIDNLVRSNWAHLLSFDVHEVVPTKVDHQVQGTSLDPPKTKTKTETEDEEFDFKLVEAFFFAPPLGPIIENLNLLEWKIRKNYSEEVIFCTEEILEY